MSAKAKPKTKPRVVRRPAAKAKLKTPRRRRAEAGKIEAPPVKREPVAAEKRPQKTFNLAVRLHGSFAVPESIEKSLRNLRLVRKFNAVLLGNDKAILGMLRHAKDYLTWGEVDAQSIATLIRKRGELQGGAAVTDEFVKEKFKEESLDGLAEALANGRISLRTLWQKGIKPVFRLHPPTGGFKYSTKRAHGTYGELGYRGKEISALISRMM